MSRAKPAPGGPGGRPPGKNQNPGSQPQADEQERGGPRRGGERGPRTVRPWGGRPAPYTESLSAFAALHSLRRATKNHCNRITTYTGDREQPSRRIVWAERIFSAPPVPAVTRGARLPARAGRARRPCPPSTSQRHVNVTTDRDHESITSRSSAWRAFVVQRSYGLVERPGTAVRYPRATSRGRRVKSGQDRPD